MKQSQEEVQEVAKEASMLMPPIQQYDSSLEFTPSWVRYLLYIYESYNTTMVEPKCYEESSKKKRQLGKSSSIIQVRRPSCRHFYEGITKNQVQTMFGVTKLYIKEEC